MRARLIEASLDLWLLAGLPVLAAVAAMGARGLSYEDYGLLLQICLVVCSYPHFMASYYAFYGQRSLWKEQWFASLVVPVSLLCALVYIYLTQQRELLEILVRLGWVLLFWHYLKQSYGSCIWLGTMRNQSLQNFPRTLLLSSFLLVGAMGFLSTQGGEGSSLVFGLYLPSLAMPEPLLALARVLAVASVVVCFLYGIKTAWRNGAIRGALTALLPLLALWIWFEPSLQSPLTIALLPALHGLQYLPFVGRALWNDRLHKPRREQTMIGLWLLFMALGFGGFYLLPRALNQNGLASVMSGCLLFLNIHHYFIDASMWRLSRPEVRARLLSS